MDLWKLLLLAVVVVGLVLVLSRPPELPRLPEGIRVEEGTFKVFAGGSDWEEVFGVYPVELGFRVVSIVHHKGKVLWEADLLYDPRWQPLAGTLTRRAPQEVRHIFLFSEGAVEVRIQRGPRETRETVALAGEVLFWEPEILGSWYALLRARPNPGGFLAFSAWKGEKWAGTLDAGREVRLKALGREIPATLRHLVLEDRRFQVYQQGDLLLGFWAPEFSAYLLEVLPEGFQR